MTREEKVAQLVGEWVMLDPSTGEVAPYQGTFVAEADRRSIGERIEHGLGQVTRPFGSAPVSAAEGARIVNGLQRRLVEDTRLGIPAIVHEECLTGFMALGATAFPCPLNWGSTWDPALIEEMGRAIGEQMRSVGVHQGLAPVMDVVRDARWGRVEECIGEDPYLVGMIGSAYVRGLEGAGVIATLKHFAGYSSSEGGRNLAPAHIGPREMEDVFLVPFEMAVREGGARSVMNAYQDNDGVPAASWCPTTSR
jgi:beta-glucosidase-like glycosyl hydrolase